MLKRIELWNYKRFQKYAIKLSSGNLLVGPNNAGKSSLLDALRTLEICLRFSRRRKPEAVLFDDGSVFPGYNSVDGFANFNFANTIFNYGDEDAVISITTSKDYRCNIRIHPNRRVKFYADVPLQKYLSIRKFNEIFDFNIVVVPTISALEIDEQIVSSETLQKNVSTRLASRNFRNYWNNSSNEQFDAFKRKLESTWAGIEINRPERDFTDAKPGLHMFFDENRISREVAWAGFGFQAWMQIYTHILRRHDNKDNILVLDEPDIYLHPDLQRKLLRDVRQMFSQFFIASHSIEIINEARTSEIVSVNDRYKTAKRISSDEDYASLFSYLGSNSNYELASLAKARKVLFVEGKDGRILRRFGAQFGFESLKIMNEIPIITLGGFSQWKKAIHAIWAFKQIAGLEIEPLALFDRDYRCNEEVSDFIKECTDGDLRVKILERKEIENYFLADRAIHKAISKKHKVSIEAVREIMIEATDIYEHKVRSQLDFNLTNYAREKRPDIHPSTTSEKFSKNFSKNWKELAYRVSVCPGKDTLASINEIIMKKGLGSITPPAIISCMTRSDIDDYFRKLLSELDDFAKDPN